MRLRPRGSRSEARRPESDHAAHDLVLGVHVLLHGACDLLHGASDLVHAARDLSLALCGAGHAGHDLVVGARGVRHAGRGVVLGPLGASLGPGDQATLSAERATPVGDRTTASGERSWASAEQAPTTTSRSTHMKEHDAASAPLIRASRSSASLVGARPASARNNPRPVRLCRSEAQLPRSVPESSHAASRRPPPATTFSSPSRQRRPNLESHEAPAPNSRSILLPG